MKIQVGEYVRLARNQGINKIIEIEDDGCLVLDDIIANEWGDETDRICPQDIEEEILNHSFNIIDLIEKDDYINGCRVYEVEERGITVYQKVENSSTDYNWITKDEIENVVTKEAFESIKYEV